MTQIAQKLYVGAMNDALFVLTQPPSPSGSDLSVDTPHPGQKVICKVETGEGHEVDSAYANLFAASAEMRDVLQDIIACWEIGATPERFINHLLGGGFIDVARDALAKALGPVTRGNFHERLMALEERTRPAEDAE